MSNNIWQVLHCFAPIFVPSLTSSMLCVHVQKLSSILFSCANNGFVLNNTTDNTKTAACLQVFRAGHLFFCEVVTAFKVVHTTVSDLDPFGRRGCVVDNGNLVDRFDDVLQKDVIVGHICTYRHERTHGLPVTRRWTDIERARRDGVRWKERYTDEIKRLSIIYKMEHNLIDMPLDHYIQHNTRSSRKHDTQFLQIRYSANIFGKASSQQQMEFSPPKHCLK